MSNHDLIEKNLKAYAEDCAARLLKTDFSKLADIAEVLIDAKQRGATIFTAGNGGSAATASHMCNDLTKGCRVWGRTGFCTECLSDSMPMLTCLSNDFCYEDAYKIALQSKAKKGDVLVAFSGSGNSENVLRAYRAARDMGITTIGFSGRNGGKMASENLCDYLLIAPTDSMEQLEDMHMLYEHALACIIKERLEKEFGIEILNYKRNSKINTALFDFDGT
ncbi:MAG: SIS domain-containing protein, partial [Eubacteriales bacterium]